MLILTKSTREHIIRILADKQNQLCNICGTKLYRNNYNIDHIIPKSKLIKEIRKRCEENKNFNYIYELEKYIKKMIEEYCDCMSNLQLLCYNCNMKKNAKVDDKILNEYLEIIPIN